MSEPSPVVKLILCAAVADLFIVATAPMLIAVLVTVLTVVAAVASFRWRRRR